MVLPLSVLAFESDLGQFLLTLTTSLLVPCKFIVLLFELLDRSFKFFNALALAINDAFLSFDLVNSLFEFGFILTLHFLVFVFILNGAVLCIVGSLFDSRLVV